jgi:hypothetical protein
VVPPWVRTSLVVVGQILLIWAVFLLLCVVISLTVTDPLHRPMGQHMRELFWPGLFLAIVFRIFKFTRLVRFFKSE